MYGDNSETRPVPTYDPRPVDPNPWYYFYSLYHDRRFQDFPSSYGGDVERPVFRLSPLITNSFWKTRVTVLRPSPFVPFPLGHMSLDGRVNSLPQRTCFLRWSEALSRFLSIFCETLRSRSSTGGTRRRRGPVRGCTRRRV